MHVLIMPQLVKKYFTHDWEQTKGKLWQGYLLIQQNINKKNRKSVVSGYPV